MKEFLIYEVKVAAVLLVFYLFYRFLLKKETFHRFNRVVLVGTAILSFILPFCIITIHKTVEADPSPMTVEVGKITASAPIEASSDPWWQTALFALFWAGVAFVLIRVVISILSIRRIIRQGNFTREDEGCRIVLTDREIDPFSWMNYIVMSREDYTNNAGAVIAHEKAHFRYRHSIDVLLVDILAAFQWFNPAIWMLRSDLKEIHEYEADDAVLRAGADLKDYQYLLIRKAVGKSGYSVANSFNHSILKNRITMMSKSRSPHARGLRALYVLPLICLGLVLQAQTVIVPQEHDKDNKNPQIIVRADAYATKPLYILLQLGQEEKALTDEEFSQIESNKIKSIEILKDQASIEKYSEKYGVDANNGIVVITMKMAQDLNDVVVVRYDEPKDELVPFYLVAPDTYAKFQGGEANEFSKWLSHQLRAPSVKVCKHTGTVRAGFVVASDGSVQDVEILESVCEELDALVVATIAKSPKWEPATSKGKAVAQYLNIPVEFVLRQSDTQ